MQGVSDAFDGVDAPLTLVLMVDVLTTAMYLGIRVFNGPVLAALLILHGNCNCHNDFVDILFCGL